MTKQRRLLGESKLTRIKNHKAAMATDGSFEKSQPLKLTLPKLKNARQFIQWKEHVQSYLSNIQARCYLDYKVQDPLYVSKESDARDIQERAWLLVRHFFTSSDLRSKLGI